MAIYYYQGKPGHGKSYSIIRRVIVPALKDNRKVVTNIPLTDECQQLGGSYEILAKGTTLQAIAELLIVGDSEADYEGNPDYMGAVFVLDEFFFMCPSGTRANTIPSVVKAFFAMHRHLASATHSTQIVICSQDASQICTAIKNMVDQSFVIEKTDVGKKSVGSIKVYSGCAGVTGGAAKPTFVRMLHFKYDPEYFKYYQSQTLGDGDSIADETKIDDATNLKNNPWFKYGLPFTFIALPLALYVAYQQIMSFGASDVLKDDIQAESGTTPASTTNGTGSQAKSSAAPIQFIPPAFPPDKLYLAGLWWWKGEPRYSFVYVPDAMSEPVYLTGSELRSEGYRVQLRGKNNVYLHYSGGVKLLAYRQFNYGNERSTGTETPQQPTPDITNPFADIFKTDGT